jgi:hypothetical protein
LVSTGGSHNDGLAIPSFGSVSIFGATATYTPSAGYRGDDVFTFKANDGHADSNEALVSLNVDDAPTAQNGASSTAENAPVDIALQANDVNGQALTFAVVGLPAHGNVTISNATATQATATYVPAANYSGTDSFTFKANDGQLDSNVATVSLAVTSSCIPESDTELCSEATYNCGAASITDSCGTARMVDCGACGRLLVCSSEHV